jgi:hypothetical protein
MERLKLHSRKHSWRSLASGIAAAAMCGVALFAAAPAVAGIPGLNVAVDSLVPLNGTIRPISYSTAGTPTQAAYNLQIVNPNTGTSQIFFGAQTTVSNGSSAQFGTTIGLRPGDSCSTSNGGTILTCAFGPIAKGTELDVTLIVLSPTAPSDGSQSVLSLAWDVQAGQGQLNPSNFVHFGSQDVTLQVGSAANGVSSYVLPNNDLGVSDSGTSTDVTPPIAVVVGVKQVVNPQSCSAQFKQCFQSTVRIVDLNDVLVQFTPDNPLVIDLLRDVSTLQRTAKIANAQLLYLSDAANAVWVPIQTCNKDGTIPNGTDRCVTAVVKKWVPGTTGVDKAGNWHFHVIALTNGIINW